MGERQDWAEFAPPAICRILDANLDRAREGLRTIEEWCRFGIESGELTELCKAMRQELARWHLPELRSARDTPDDPGTNLTHAGERHRDSLDGVLRASFCRVQEALRVLEEYAKLYDEEMSETCKHMRYEVYTLESQLLAYQRHQKLARSPLYLVTSSSDRVVDIVESALQGGLTIVQYRDKKAEDLVKLNTARKLRQLCHRYGALFLVNDRIDLALAVNADGVHLGQDDFPISLARQFLGSQRLIGRSTTNPQEMERAIEEGADYVGVGPVYQTPTKPGKAAAGLEYVRYAADNCPIPWFAIGGIDMNNINAVFSAGGERIAVVRAIMEAEQPTLVTQYFVSQLKWIDTVRSIREADGA